MCYSVLYLIETSMNLWKERYSKIIYLLVIHLDMPHHAYLINDHGYIQNQWKEPWGIDKKWCITSICWCIIQQIEPYLFIYLSI